MVIIMYKNNNIKKLNNTQTIYSSLNNNDINIENKKEIKNSEIKDNIPLEKKIDNIFNSPNYIYKADVNIVTDKGVLNKRVVARNKNNLITFDNEYIPISIIRDIYK